MDSLYLLIPIALIFCAVTIKLLLWAIDSGQYDDLDKEAWRIIADDEPDTDHPQTRGSQPKGSDSLNTKGSDSLKNDQGV